MRCLPRARMHGRIVACRFSNPAGPIKSLMLIGVKKTVRKHTYTYITQRTNTSYPTRLAPHVQATLDVHAEWKGHVVRIPDPLGRKCSPDWALLNCADRLTSVDTYTHTQNSKQITEQTNKHKQ